MSLELNQSMEHWLLTGGIWNILHSRPLRFEKTSWPALLFQLTSQVEQVRGVHLDFFFLGQTGGLLNSVNKSNPTIPHMFMWQEALEMVLVWEAPTGVKSPDCWILMTGLIESMQTQERHETKLNGVNDSCLKCTWACYYHEPAVVAHHHIKLSSPLLTIMVFFSFLLPFHFSLCFQSYALWNGSTVLFKHFLLIVLFSGLLSSLWLWILLTVMIRPSVWGNKSDVGAPRPASIITENCFQHLNMPQLQETCNH